MFIYPDPTPILALFYTFSVFKTPIYGSGIHTSVSGRETRTQSQVFPIWEFKLKFDALRTQTENIIQYTQWAPRTDYEKILAVFLACKGRYGRFFFQDPSDCSRMGQFISIADGAATSFRVGRTFGTGDFTLLEPIGGVDLSHSVAVYVDAVQVFNWNISDDLQYLVFHSVPAADAVITMDFYFFFFCRFLEDFADFEEFMGNLHSINELGFVSVKTSMANS